MTWFLEDLELAQPTLEILSLWVAGDIDGATRRAASEQEVQQ